jgi:hypothetical protein
VFDSVYLSLVAQLPGWLAATALQHARGVGATAPSLGGGSSGGGGALPGDVVAIAAERMQRRHADALAVAGHLHDALVAVLTDPPVVAAVREHTHARCFPFAGVAVVEEDGGEGGE